MTTPSNTIYVRPNWGSTTWTYAGTSMPTGASSAAVTAVAFDVDSTLGQQLARGQLQYSFDNGKTWNGYTAPVDGQGAYVQATGTLWRFLDRSADVMTPNVFSAHYKLADGSVVSQDNTVIVDNPPAGLSGENDTMFSTMQAGAVVDLLSPIDSGAMTGGRWVIDSQSQPGLFSIAYNPATDTAARLVLKDAAQLPALGLSAVVTVHYYDRYQLDTNGNPIAGQGVARTLGYTVQDGLTHDLPGFGDDLKLGAAGNAWTANPSLAALSNGGFVAAWQGSDTIAGGAGAGLWAQLRDASGAATGAAFALTPDGDAGIEGEPAVAALSGGRFVVAYSVNDGAAHRIAYRVVEANGRAGAEHLLDGGASGDAAMPTVATLADGSFAIGWRSGGAVHVQQAAADGTVLGSQQVYGVLSSAFSPSLAALKQGGYLVSWGEINDGNVYAATSAGGQAFVVNGDGYAASLATAAPLPHVATLANGNVVVAWDSYVNAPFGFSMSDIFFRVYDSAGHALGGPMQANLESGGGHYDAAVTALSDGSFVVAWQSDTGDYDGSGIFGRRFGADGSAVDQQEFEINQMRAGDQTSPDVVALANGGFAAAWVDSQAAGVAVEARVFASASASASGIGTTPVRDGSQGSSSGNSTTPPLPIVTAPVATAPVVTTPVVTAPSVSVTPVVMAPGTPASTGGAIAAQALATAGNNVLAASSGGGVLDGKDGMDTVVFGKLRANYTITSDGVGVSLVDLASGSKTVLANVERLQFGDQSIALDIHGNAGETFRLYQAAFNRTPDKSGLGFWINAMDDGHSLLDVATSFVNSSEFAQKYGTTSDAQFVDALYQNVLHRAPDAAGYGFWLQALHGTSRAQVLVNFSESTENQTQVLGAISNGISYTPARTGTGGNDVMAAIGGAQMDGGSGVDTVVFGGAKDGYTVTSDGVGVSVVDLGSGSKTVLANVERLQFGDRSIALDIHGNAGETFRLYQAAFNRTPDKSGLGFWMNAMDDGHSLLDVATSFVNSSEFAQKYGTTSDAQFVDALYQNVLHRAPDAAGYDFWLQALHGTSRAQLLVDFSESTENQAQIIGMIQNGIEYTPVA
ncbi:MULTISPECIES: DUF4214 domain-containing protein [unclassified Massilia]|uniref:DUF4214 domain-containing protein n=1 Tax=unclassified Massilia TaxID=2609279 RepID=UPI0006919E33|nr:MULTISPECIES: DUF4214 domain-containing protein [unclassified Massilia]AWG45976.1 hypothetical protein AM586_28240 [Massilia sp. WG5]